MSASNNDFSPNIPLPTPPPLMQDWRFRHRGLAGAVILGPALVATALSAPLIREGTWADSGMDLLAWVCFVGGLCFRFWSTLYVGGRKRQSLVTQGPYSICRNPLYVGSLLLALSAGCYLKGIVFLAFLSLAALAYMRFTVPAEERDLRRIHGAAFDEYCRRTPRFMPRFSLYQSPVTVEVSLHGLRLEMKRCLLWVWLPVLGEMLAHARVTHWWPKLFQLL